MNTKYKIVGFILAQIILLSGLITNPIYAQPGDPLQIVVSLNEQNLRVFRGLEQIAYSNISSGKDGNSTPTGIFSVLQKRRYHRSNIYSNAPMPFMQRLTWSGIALHASNHVPDYPASHGCIRMPSKIGPMIWEKTKSGTQVRIVP